MTNDCDRCKIVKGRHSFDCPNHPLRKIGGPGYFSSKVEYRNKVPKGD